MNDGRSVRKLPKIKRWFPVSHEINHSGTMRDLMREFGLPGLRVWLEILSIADRSGEYVDCLSSGALSRITSAAETKYKRTSTIVLWLHNRGCMALEPHQNPLSRVVNYWEYHRTEERNPVPTRPDRTRPEPDLKNAAPSADLKIVNSRKLVPALKAAADPIYHSNPPKFARLVVWIKDKQKRDYADEIIVDSLVAFWTMEQKSKIKDWWPYIEKIFRKAYAKWNEEQAAKHKSDDAQFVRDLVGATSRILKA